MSRRNASRVGGLDRENLRGVCVEGVLDERRHGGPGEAGRIIAGGHGQAGGGREHARSRRRVVAARNRHRPGGWRRQRRRTGLPAPRRCRFADLPELHGLAAHFFDEDPAGQMDGSAHGREQLEHE